jgi:hypothetical protein
VIAEVNAQWVDGVAYASGANVGFRPHLIGATSVIVAGVGTSGLTFAAPTVVNWPEGIAQQINAQVLGVSAGVVADQPVITTDSRSLNSSLVAAAGTGALTWAAPVAGTGQSGTVIKGTLLARNSATGLVTVYSATGADQTNIPRYVMAYEEIWTTAGNKQVSVLKGGTVAKNLLREHDVAGAVADAVLDALAANSNITAIQATDLSRYSN